MLHVLLPPRSTPSTNATMTFERASPPLLSRPILTANAAARPPIAALSSKGAPPMFQPPTSAATKSSICAGVTLGLERPNTFAILPMAEAVRVVSVRFLVLRRFPASGVVVWGVKYRRLRRDALEGDLLLRRSRSARVKVVMIALRGMLPHTKSIG
jgi:hypothetical protein